MAACENVKLYSLQKNFGREQLAGAGWAIENRRPGGTLDEGTGAFLDTAAVMMNLDLVVTSDTAMRHLAGALGVPVWVALQLRQLAIPADRATIAPGIRRCDCSANMRSAIGTKCSGLSPSNCGRWLPRTDRMPPARANP